MICLLDTNHAIAFLNGDLRLQPHLMKAQAAHDELAISSTVLGELCYGAYASQRQSDNLARLAAFVSQTTVYPFDEAAAWRFGQICAEQRRKGRSIPTADAQIAAVAQLHGLTLLTDDQHFEWINGLAVENWLQ